MANISSLIVKLEAQTAAFDRAINRSRGTITRMADVAKTAAKVVAGIAVAAVAAFTAFGVAGLREINKVSAEIDEMVKAAGNLRFDVGDLQELRFIAGQTGTSVSEMERSIQRMNRQLSAGSEATAKALGSIGMSIDQVMAMKPADRFQTISKALAGVTDEAAQTTAMVELFGRSGGDMLNLINADFDKLGETFTDMGIRLTNQQGQAVEAYQDAKDRLGTLWSGFKQQFTANMAGPLTRIVEWIEEYTSGMGGMDQVAERAAAGIINALASIVEGGAGLLEFINDVLIGFKKMQLFDLEQRKWQVALAGGLGFNVDESVFSEAEKVKQDIERLEQRGGGLSTQAERMRGLATELSGDVGRGTSETTPVEDKALNESMNRIFQRADELRVQEVQVKLDLRTDVGNLTGQVTGSREFSEAVKTLAAQAVNNTARGVAA